MENKLSRFERKWVYRNNDYLTLVNALMRSNFFFVNNIQTEKLILFILMILIILLF